jgi:hypothetical protein
METAKSGRRGVFLPSIARVLANTEKTLPGAAVGFLGASPLQSNIPTIRGAVHFFFGVKPSDVDGELTFPVVGCCHSGLPGSHRVLAYVAGVVVVEACVSGFGLTRPGAFLARLRAVDEGEGEPT